MRRIGLTCPVPSRRLWFGVGLIGLIGLSLIGRPTLATPYYPADPDAVSKQWYLEKVEAYEAWSRSRGGEQIIVAVIDTGVDVNHPDIAQNLWHNPAERVDGQDNDRNIYVDDVSGWDFIDGDNDPTPNPAENGALVKAVHHGTLVAGIIGAVGGNGLGGTGLAWQVKIMPLRALDSKGRGNVADVIEAIRYAVAKGAHIINLSFVGPGFDRDLFLTLQDALRRGVLTVAAVGNSENGNGMDLDLSPLYPVCYTGSSGEDVVLGVAAVDHLDRKFVHSNFGANCVDLSAPGVDIYGPVYQEPAKGFTTFFEGGFSGSSMAAPVVSGTAALIKALNPAYAAQEIRNILVQTGDPINPFNPTLERKLGQGRLNARRALELAAQGGSAVFGPSRGGVPYLLVAPFSSKAPEVKILLGSGTPARAFMAYGSNFLGGVRLAAGDVDGDGRDEIVTGSGLGGGPHVRAFKSDGTAMAGFFAYDPRFRGGVNVAVGDLDGNGVSEIITAAGPGGGPHIRIFDSTGRTLGGFFAYDTHLRGGVHLAVADLDNDGLAEIITAPGKGSGYQGEIRIFNGGGKLKRAFLAYPATFAGGVNVAAGDLDGSGAAAIVTAPAQGAISEVRIYDASGAWQRAFLAYTESFRGGANLAVGDLNGDGKAEILTGPASGGGPHLIMFDGFGKPQNQFFPLDPSFRGGVSVGIIRL